MIEVIRRIKQKRWWDKSPIPLLTLQSIIILALAFIVLSGCEPRPWERLGYHAPIVKSGIGGAGI